MNGRTADRDYALHSMLIRLAGYAPDDLISSCRSWLAAGREVSVAWAVAFAATHQGLRLYLPDLELVCAVLAEAGLDSGAAEQAQIVSTEPAVAYEFQDTSAPHQDGALEAVAVATAAGIKGARALWRAWRFPAGGAPWPCPRRIFVLEVDASTDLVESTARVQTVLESAGERAALVEVYTAGVVLPAYQRLARQHGALLWSATPPLGMRTAAVFDAADEDGGWHFSDDHPRLDPAEAERVGAFLRAGAPLLTTSTLVDDVVDASARTVPVSMRTDGSWIWTESSTYYLEKYLLAPDPDLLEHIRAHDYQTGQPGADDMRRALRALRLRPGTLPR